LLSDRLNGLLRSPILPTDKKFLSLQVLGDKWGAYRRVIDHCAIGEDHQLLQSPSPKWLKLSARSAVTTARTGLAAAPQYLPIYVELSTRDDDPRLPERPAKHSIFGGD